MRTSTGKWGLHRARSVCSWILVASLFAALLVACGGNDNAVEPSNSGTQAKPVRSLHVVAGAVDPSLAVVWFARIEGYFEKHSLDVSITSGGGNTINLIVAKQADIALYSAPAAFTPIRNGLATSIIYGTLSGAAGDFVVGTPDVKSVHDCTRMATFSPGSNTYAWAVKNKALYGANYGIQTFADFPTLLAALSSGNADCSTAVLSAFTGLMESGEVHLIVDPRDPSTLPDEFPEEFVANAFWGLKDHLRAERDAVLDFIRAVHEAFTAMKKMTPGQVAERLRTDSDWRAQSKETIEGGYADVADFFQPNDGYMVKTAFDNSAQFYKDGGLDFINPDDPAYSYANVVDMSFYDEALGAPESES